MTRDPVGTGFALTAATLIGVVVGFVADARGEAVLSWTAFGVAFAAGGVPAAREAVRELREQRKLDVDLLMVVAAVGAASVGRAGDGGILLFLFSLSNALQAWAFSRTKGAIQALMALHPEVATRVGAEGEEEEVAAGELEVGDRVVVRPGERFAADLRVESGHTSADESAITGESVPVWKAPGDTAYSGTLNGDGVVWGVVERQASDSTLAKLIRLVEAAQAAKSPTEQFAERLEGPYTVAVLLSVPVVFSVLRFGVGVDVGDAWYRAMTFLVVASPCAVVISTPAAVLSAMAAGARRGTLFKSGAALEALASTRIFAFDKTGTLTRGVMKVARIEVVRGTEAGARALAAGLERHADHPIAGALAATWTGPAPAVEDVRSVRGHGVEGRRDGREVWAGSRRLVEHRGIAIDAVLERRLDSLERDGLTPVLLGTGEEVVAVFGVADAARVEARSAVAALKARGARVVMLTGDRARVARRIAGELGIDEVRAELLPEQKLEAIAELKRAGRVAMVGDGVNDAPALAAADLGIAVGSASDVALESADLVLVRSDLSQLDDAVALARRTAATIRFNLAFALGVIAVVGVLALVGRVPLPLGVVAHEGGTIFVVLVGLRLLGFGGASRRSASRVLEVDEAARDAADEQIDVAIAVEVGERGRGERRQWQRERRVGLEPGGP